MSDHDFIVVGAGPGGSAAACTLARSGASVALLEAAEMPRDKCCGDGLTAAALRELEGLGVRAGAIASLTPVSAAHALAPSGEDTVLEGIEKKELEKRK
jgi:flavin-dependent dehydrogenase